VKKIFLISLLLISGWTVFAQKERVKYITTFDDKRLHFGFTLGVNTLDFNVQNYMSVDAANLSTADAAALKAADYDYIRCDVAQVQPGFTVGIVTSLRLNQFLNMRFLPGLSFGDRTLTYNVPVLDDSPSLSGIDDPTKTHEYTVRSTFLDFPLLVKYKARRINNDRPYVIFGGALRQDISKSAQEDLIQLNKTGLYAEVGGGWDHYFPFFRLSVEGKFSFGLNNQKGSLPDATQQSQVYMQSIKSLHSKIFTLSFHFE
jgi:hypothetical protein